MVLEVLEVVEGLGFYQQVKEFVRLCLVKSTAHKVWSSSAGL